MIVFYIVFFFILICANIIALLIELLIVEIENMDQLREVVLLDVQRVILDNWDYEKISSAISLIKNKFKEVEISGGVNFSNFESYCLLKPDFISVGTITNPKKSFDMSMLVERQ